MGKERQNNCISLKDIGLLSALAFGAIKTNIIGNLMQEKGRDWPKSGSYILPIIESVGQKKTPKELYPIIDLFYNYIRTADNLFDKGKSLPSWNNIKDRLSTVENPLFEKLRRSKGINKPEQEYLLERVDSLGKSTYKTMVSKTRWTEVPSFEEAYSYRWDTTGLLSDVIADIWCVFARVPDDVLTTTREVMKKLGMVFQFRDDIVDLREDGKMDGNLILALLNEEKERESLFNSFDKSKKINIIKHMKTLAPKSTKRFINYMERDLKYIKERSPSVGSGLANIVKFATYNGIFIKTE